MLQAADALSLLFAMQCSQQNGQTTDQESAIRDKATQIKDAIQAARQAAEQAREAAEDKSFWDDLCSVAETITTGAAIVASAASCVASGGLTAPAVIALAGTLLSAEAAPIANALGGGEDLATGLAIAGGALSIGGGAGAALGIGAVSSDAAVSSGVKSAAQALRGASVVVHAGATGVTAYATYRSGSAEGDRLDAEGSGLQSRAQERAAQRELSGLVDALKTLDKSFHSTKGALISAQKDLSDSQMAALTVGRFA